MAINVSLDALIANSLNPSWLLSKVSFEVCFLCYCKQNYYYTDQYSQHLLKYRLNYTIV